MSARNIGLGAGFGLCLGMLFLGIAALTVGSASQLPRSDPSLPLMAAIYLGGGVVGGAIVGALASVAQWWLGSAVVGFIAMFPVVFAMVIAEQGTLSTEIAADAVFLSAAIGIPSGLGIRYLWRTIDPFGPL